MPPTTPPAMAPTGVDFFDLGLGSSVLFAGSRPGPKLEIDVTVAMLEGEVNDMEGTMGLEDLAVPVADPPAVVEADAASGVFM